MSQQKIEASKRDQFAKSYDELHLILSTLVFEEKISKNTFDKLNERLNDLRDSQVIYADVLQDLVETWSGKEPLKLHSNGNFYEMTIKKLDQ